MKFFVISTRIFLGLIFLSSGLGKLTHGLTPVGPPGNLGLVKDLASVYFDEHRLSDLQKLTRETDAFLYAPPGMAEKIDPAHLYDFHRTIGTFHALLETRAFSSSSPSAAVDQLQKAVTAADTLSQKLVAEGKPAFRVDPAVMQLLERSGGKRLDNAIHAKRD